METDFYKGILYWGDGRFVKKANTDGTNLQTLYTGSNQIGGLALDLINNKLYFSDYGSANVTIRRCNLDGTGMEVIVTSPNYLNGRTYNLTISPTLQKLYWTESTISNANSIIMRCNLDGTNVETLITTTSFIPGLTIDEKNQRLYLAYYYDNKVMTTDMTCSTTPTLVFGSSNGTFQMAVSNVDEKLYFAEISTKKIRSCNLDGSSPQDIVSGLSGSPYALAIPTVPPAPTIYANETYTFELDDFLFASVDKNLLAKIKITTLTSKGTLYLDANSNNIVDAGEAVVLNQEIPKTDIVAGTLKFNPVANDYGSPYTTFNFKWFDGSSYSTLDYLQYIYVLNIAPTVTTQAVSDIGSTTATGNGNITNLGVPFPTSYGVCWNTTGSPTTSDSKVDKGSISTTGAFTAAISGLTANTTYKVRAYATNEVGTSYGTEVSFTTNVFTPPTATTNAATSITSAGAILNGSINANNASTTVTFEYGLDTSYGTTVTADQSPVTGSTTTFVSKAITGLTAGTTYHYRVVGVNTNETTTGDDMTFTTLKLPSVTTQAVSSILTNSVVANGNITDLGQPNPTAYGFCWSTSPNPTTDNSTIDKGSISIAGSFSATLTGLETFTKYYVRAYSINEAGTSYGEQVSFSTKGIAANVALYEINDIESTTAIGKCSITDFGFPNATAYGICWSTSPNPTMFNSKIHNLGAPTTIGFFYASLTELEPNTVYYARVYAANAEGIAYSYEISFKTTQSNPVITWSNPSDISYGTALNDLQLNATSTVEGTFEYTPAAGTKLNVGDAQELSVTFTPKDLTKNKIVNKTVQINVRKAVPVITWENPKDIVNGTALSDLQLNAVANIEGTFVYNPIAGTVMNTGDLQELTVQFSPADTEHYSATSDTVKINVVIKTGIDPEKQNSISIYPNPTTDKFYITGIEDQTTIRISSLNGKLISEKKVANHEAISVQNLPAGTYLIGITNKEAMTCYKLVKK